MAYQKTIWSSNDLITAAKLNNLEEGIETLDEKIGDTTGSIGAQIAANTSNITANTEDITDLTTQVNNLSNNIQLDIDRLYNNTGVSSDSTYSASRKLEARIDKLAINTGTNFDITTQSKNLDTRIKDLLNSINSVNAEQNSDIANLQAQIAALTNGSGQITYRGAYENGTSYAKNDVVSFLDTTTNTTSYYICTNSSGTTGGTGEPPSSDWEVLIMPTQLEGLVYYGNTAPGTTNSNAQFWVKTDTSGDIEETEIEVASISDFDTFFPVYDPTKTYSVGQYVRYKRTTDSVYEIYLCQYNITTPEVWTRAHWIAQSLDKILQDLKDRNSYDLLQGRVYLGFGTSENASYNSRHSMVSNNIKFEWNDNFSQFTVSANQPGPATGVVNCNIYSINLSFMPNLKAGDTFYFEVNDTLPSTLYYRVSSNKTVNGSNTSTILTNITNAGLYRITLPLDATGMAVQVRMTSNTDLTDSPITLNRPKMYIARSNQQLDEELTDVRIGANGTTYTTAGNAVRGQITELMEQVTELKNVVYQIRDSLNINL